MSLVRTRAFRSRLLLAMFLATIQSAGLLGLVPPLHVAADSPTGSIAVANGAAYTSIVNVELTLTWSDDGSGVTQMRVANSYAALGAAPITDAAPTLIWDLSAAPDGSTAEGTHAVFAQFRDDSDGWSDVTWDTIILDSMAPTATKPGWRFVSGATAGTGTSVDGLVSWTGADSGSGILRYRLIRTSPTGGQATNVGPTVPTDKSVPQSLDAAIYRFQVKANDGAGNVGVSPAPDLSVRASDLSETSNKITYSGAWSAPTTRSGARGGKVRSATSRTASATVAFTGFAFAWVAPRSPSNGSARVYIDDHFAGTVDLHTGTEQPRRIVFARQLPGGSHTVKIVPVGTFRHARVEIDSFFVAR